MLPDEIVWKDRKYIRESLVVPTGAFTRQVKHDWQRNDWKGYVFRPNLPEVYRCGKLNDYSGIPDQYVNGHYSRLTAEWQFFWFDLCCLSYYGKVHNQLTKDQYNWLALRWTSVGGNRTAFTNGHGLDKYRNYVLNSNRDTVEEPMIYTLICGGMTTKEISVTKNIYGKDMLKMPAFNGRESPPDVTTIDIRNDPRIFTAVNITSTKVSTGGYAVNPFPQFKKDTVPQDVLIPLIASDDIYFPADYCYSVNSVVKLNPYNAPRSVFQKYPAQ